MGKITKVKQGSRVPVVYKRKPLMPMTWYRARVLMKKGRGILIKSKELGWYFNLKDEPSGFEVQEMSLGIDEGTLFTGYSVVSPKVHNANFQRDTYKVDKIQKSTGERRGERRIRRSRLRHRKIRYSYRNGERISKTHHYYLQVRKQMISRIKEFYPISTIVLEDIRYNHWGDTSGNGRGFSSIEIIKNKLRKWIEALGITLRISKARDAKSLRMKQLGFNQKIKDKSYRGFYAHCMDSYCLANSIFSKKIFSKINKLVLFIVEKSTSYQRKSGRRNLREFTANAKDCWKGYVRFPKGIKTYIHKFHKARKCRIKISEDQGNHGPWEYLLNFDQNSTEYIRRGFLRLHGSFTSSWRNKFKGPKFYDNYLDVYYGI